MATPSPKPTTKVNLKRRYLRFIAWVVATPFILFALLSVLVYLPPVQQWLVNKVATDMGEKMGLDVKVGEVRLSFPLDLMLGDVIATTKDTPTDTVLAVEGLKLNLEFLPLIQEAQANIDGFALYGAVLNSKHFIPDTELRGRIGRIEADTRGINWERQEVDLQRVHLERTQMLVLLSDTAQKDTTSTPTRWKIRVQEATIAQTAVEVRMPHDSMRVATSLQGATMRSAMFDLGTKAYTIAHLGLNGHHLRYDLPYTPKQAQGFDTNHILLDSVVAAVDSFSYDSVGNLAVIVKQLALREASGIHLQGLSARVLMDSLHINVPHFALSLPKSHLEGHAKVPFSALTSGQGGTLMAEVRGKAHRSDLLSLAPQAKDWINHLPQAPLQLTLGVRGNVDELHLSRLVALWPNIAQVTLSGKLNSLMNKHPQGDLHFALALHNTKPLTPLLKQAGAGDIALPNGLRTSGRVGMAPNGDYTFALRTALHRGTLQADGRINIAHQRYVVRASAVRFPLARLVPGLALSPLSATLSAQGQGFNFFERSTKINLQAKVSEGRFGQYHLAGITTKGYISGGKANLHLSAHTSQLDLDGQLQATLSNRGIEGHLTSHIASADMRALGLTTDTMTLGATTDLAFALDRKAINITAKGQVDDLRIITNTQALLLDNIHLDLATRRDTTTLAVNAGDLHLALNAQGSWQRLSNRLGLLALELSKQIDKKYLDHQRLRRELPKMDLLLTTGSRNPLTTIMAYQGLDFRSAFLALDISPSEGINGSGRIDSIRRGGLLIDAANIAVIHDSTGLRTELAIDNSSKRNPNRFTANLRANLLPTGFSTDITYLDAKGKIGVMMGVKAEVSDSGFRAQLYPETAILAYRTFQINPDNYIFLHKNKNILASVDLLADDGTALRLFNTAREDGANDITASVANLNLSDLSAVVPAMPALSGLLTGDIHLVRQGDVLSTAYSVGVKEMAYDGVSLGHVGLDGALFPQPGGQYLANAVISRNGQEVGNALGTYDGSGEGRFDGSLMLERFPMAMVNGFLEGTDVALAGSATGELLLSGALTTPKIEGTLHTDSVHILSPVYGLNLRMHDRALRFVDNRLLLDTVKFYSTASQNPLLIDGYVDMQDFSNIALSLKAKANNYALINMPRQSKSTVYGKVLTNADISISGDMQQLSILGFITVLGESNVGYVMSDNTLTASGNLKDLVTFTSFEDSTLVEAPTAASNINMTLGITIQPGANVYCDLGDGESYVDMEGSGQMSFKYLSGEMILTGQYAIDNGVMKYALPIIPLKTFNIAQGSSVTFTGDVMNPTLNITATESTKASVDDGTPRRVVFNVGIVISQTMSNLGLSFTLDAPSDLAIQNDLNAMTEEQRAKLAVTLLATGVYMSDNNNSTFNANNALNAFLQKEIQNIAGTALRSVDISFGIDNGTAGDGSTQTDYTFQFAKRFWNDRLAVIIGGTLTAGNNTAKRNNTFIDNVSLEYRLDASATRYVTLYYKRDEQDPLEGEYTVMGTSLVLRRKVNRLSELFIFRKKKASPLPTPADTTAI